MYHCCFSFVPTYYNMLNKEKVKGIIKENEQVTCQWHKYMLIQVILRTELKMCGKLFSYMTEFPL